CGWTTGALSCTVGGLTNGTPYTFTVTATNGVGTGPASLPSNSVTPATVPGPPSAVTAVLGNRSALVSWTASAANGSTVTAYTVTASDGIHTCGWTTGALSCTVGGLTNGTPYTFTVTATNGVGSGPASSVSNAVTPAAVPDKPTNVVATRGDTSASVAWTAPADNGSTITVYTVTSSPDGQTCGWTVGQLSCPVTGLRNGTAYTFTVTARNIVGMGLPSDISNSVTPAAAPGAPTGVQATGADSAAIVSWTAPASNGSPIAGYTATAWPGGRSCSTTGGLTCAITGLTNRTTYSITVTASNGVGTGPASSPATSVTPFSGATYVALTPARVLDTRSGNGLAGPFGSHAARTFQVTGRGGVPGNATAVTGNLTVTGQTSNGYLFLGPVATNVPTSSTLNFPVGDDRANGVTVALGAGGTLSVTFVAPNPGPAAQVIFDVTGYFVP
ncbi:MAG: fibronectin type III domain-containing protein, partial [Candidatus Limnocylindrales bacterium]